MQSKNGRAPAAVTAGKALNSTLTSSVASAGAAVNDPFAPWRAIVAEQVAPIMEALDELRAKPVERLWTTSELSQVLGINLQLVARMRDEEGMPFQKFGETYRYVPSQIRAWLDARTLKGGGA